jgi:hypothetical protein
MAPRWFERCPMLAGMASSAALRFSPVKVNAYVAAMLGRKLRMRGGGYLLQGPCRGLGW